MIKDDELTRLVRRVLTNPEKGTMYAIINGKIHKAKTAKGIDRLLRKYMKNLHFIFYNQ